MRKSVHDCQFIPSEDSRSYSALHADGSHSGQRSIASFSLSEQKQFLFCLLYTSRWTEALRVVRAYHPEVTIILPQEKIQIYPGDDVRGMICLLYTSNVSFNGTIGTVTVPLSFVAAKIELIVKDNRSNLTGSGSITIADEKVVLLYAGKSGKFFGTTAEKVAQTAFYSGDASYPGFNSKIVTTSTALADAVSGFSANTANVVFNHFYTFGNNGATQPTIPVSYTHLDVYKRQVHTRPCAILSSSSILMPRP